MIVVKHCHKIDPEKDFFKKLQKMVEGYSCSSFEDFYKELVKQSEAQEEEESYVLPVTCISELVSIATHFDECVKELNAFLEKVKTKQEQSN